MSRFRPLIAVIAIFAFSTYANADIRLVHASPDAPNVDVIVNDNFASPAFTNLPFTGVTDYASLPSATYNFKVVPTGANTPVVINIDLPIDETKDYTAAATGVLASITPVLYEDDNTIYPNLASVRFIHLSPNAPEVDIQLAGGGGVLFDDIAFQESGGYIQVPGGTYDLEVVLSASGTKVLDLPGIAVSNGTVYTAYAMGLAGGEPALGAVISVDAVPEPGALSLIALAGLPLLLRRLW